MAAREAPTVGLGERAEDGALEEAFREAHVAGEDFGVEGVGEVGEGDGGVHRGV